MPEWEKTSLDIYPFDCRCNVAEVMRGDANGRTLEGLAASVIAERLDARWLIPDRHAEATLRRRGVVACLGSR
jgi:hypothetical protein